MSFRGKGLEWPVVLPGEEAADKAGDTDTPRPTLRDRVGRSLLDAFVAPPAPGLNERPGFTLITPFATPPVTGNNTAGGCFSASLRTDSKLSRKDC